MKPIINYHLIGAFIIKNGWTENEFCVKCGLPCQFITGLIQEDYDFNFTLLLKIADFMGVKVKDLFN